MRQGVWASAVGTEAEPGRWVVSKGAARCLNSLGGDAESLPGVMG